MRPGKVTPLGTLLPEAPLDWVLDKPGDMGPSRWVAKEVKLRTGRWGPASGLGIPVHPWAFEGVAQGDPWRQ